MIFVSKICNQARQLFRELTETDVGIDGFIEVCEDGAPAGMFIGIQVKAGGSFVSHDGEVFTFRATQANFAYWARCHCEMVGVVYDPVRARGVWLDLSALATDERVGGGIERGRAVSS